MTAIKFCGITSLDDALAAVEAGADWLGFNFYPASRRYIEPDACRRIVQGLRGALGARFQTLRLVGVFVNAAPTEILAILNACGLHLAQLSGDEPPETLAALGERAFPVVRSREGLTCLELAGAPLRRQAPQALFDAQFAGGYGGTGRLADWETAEAFARRSTLFLAGGLTPENVGAAMRRVRPWGVDVASGIESSPGVKDPARMRAFVEAVRTSERELENNP